MPEKSWAVEFSKSALKSLERLDRKASSRILDHIREMANREDPLRHEDVRSLEGRLKGYHRLRVGEYRAIFETDSAGRRIGVLEIIPRGRGY